ncbi:MAG: porin, partial [Bacteroidota bacterium]|nr:porin [Bacteroidota bacterium]MDX5430351.1 porin [Bacteroidota bacterium]MDX5469112.1 porin [Bacteroidota bacterium]
MKRAVLFLIIAITSQHAFSGGLKEIPKIQGQIYAEPFFGFKGNWKQPQYRESFLFNYNRHNEVSLNLALVKITLDHSKYRGALGFHTGTYVRDNYISEPLPMQFIHEARAGIALFGSKKLWLDMGIMNSFLGFESPIGMENPTLTRSLTAENSPYYLSGARLAWEDSTFSFAIHYLNGWQRIQRPPDNNQAAVGTEVKWTPTATATFAWNTYA